MLSCVQLFVTPRTIACQAPLTMGFSRQEHWSGLPFLLQGLFPFPTRSEPRSLMCPAWVGGFFTTSAPWEFVVICYINQKLIQQGKTFLIGILKSQIMGKKSNLAFLLDLRK